MKPAPNEVLLTLLDKRGRQLYGLLARLTTHRQEVVAELLQELFVRLAKGDGLFRAADPSAYASRAAINLAMEWRRVRARDAARHEAASLLAAANDTPAPSPAAQAIDAEDLQRILDALPQLSEDARTCFVLRMLELQSYEQIARVVGKSVHQVRGLCHSAIRSLRAQLDDAPKVSSTREARHV